MTAPRQVDPVKWFERTGHCGVCGQPGDYCTCRGLCACGLLHRSGSARDEDALERFAAPVVLDDNQPDLFGNEGGTA